MTTSHSAHSSFQRAFEDADAGEATLGPASHQKSAGSRKSSPTESALPASSHDPQRETREELSGVFTPGEDDFDYDQLQHYEPAGELGRGGWGVVDRVVDSRLEREVALKRIVNTSDDEADLRNQFIHEARITSQLQHPGVVPVHEVGGCQSGQAYYIMKLLSGETLHALIRRTHKEQQTTRGAKRFRYLDQWIQPLLSRFLDVCHTMAYAHHRGIIHRDLKPANIMVGSFGETIVLDWGLAIESNGEEEPEAEEQVDETIRHGSQVASSDQMRVQLTGKSQRKSESDGTVVGTPAYMPPEQARGIVSRLAPPSDVYALGVILYEMIAGTHPHTGFTTQEVLHRARDGKHIPIGEMVPGLSPPLAAIVEHALQPNPDDRYADADALGEDVQRWMVGETVSVHPDSVIDRALRWSRRNRGIAMVLASSGSVLLAVSLVFTIILQQAYRSEAVARRQAEASRSLALQRLTTARDAADAWLVDLSGTLEYYPALTHVRSKLLSKAISHYQDLMQDREASLGEDSLEKLETARCMIRLGDLLKLTGNTDQSIQSFLNARQLLESIGNQDPDVIVVQPVSLPSHLPGPPTHEQNPGSEIQIELANTFVGLLLSGKDVDVGQLARTSRTLQALLPFDTSTDAPQTDSSTKAASAFARLQLALSRVRTATANDERTRLESAVQWADWLARTRGRDADRHLLYVAYQELAESVERNQSIDEAIITWDKVVKNLEASQASSKFAPDMLQRIAHARMQRAGLLAKQNRSQESAAEYEKSINELNRAWQACDSDGFYRTNLATAEFNLGCLLQDTPSKTRAACSYLERSLATYLELLRQSPTIDILRRTTEAHRLLGRLHENPTERKNALERALTGYEMLHDHGGLLTGDSHNWMDTLLDLSDVLLTQGKPVTGLQENLQSWSEENDRESLNATTRERLVNLEQAILSSNPTETEDALPSD